jgi:hypothetical protein
MLSILEMCRRHLDMVGESYWGHQRFATRIGLTMMAAGAAAVIHGVTPFLFQSTASRTARRLAALIEGRGTTVRQEWSSPNIGIGSQAGQQRSPF